MEAFAPPFCARRSCRHHDSDPATPYAAWIEWGSYGTRAFGRVPRFRCLVCGKTFSVQTFRVDYYAKRVMDYNDIAERLCNCESLSAIGRAHHASTDTVTNRISRASRQASAFESEQAEMRRPNEDLAADGFESFCGSQFFPNNINILVGSDSQFIYAADHVTLRRKGRMTVEQFRKRTAIDTVWKPDPKGVEASFARVAMEALRVLSDSARASIVLWTDLHHTYPRALAGSPCLRAMQDAGRLKHLTISSRAARTTDNPLFPVNYVDREIRKDLHEHVRETVCGGRNVNRQMERFTLYQWWHNFRKSHRARDRWRSHAIVAGYDPAHIARAMPEIWIRRAWLTLTDLTESMRDTWLRTRNTPLLEGPDYLPRYARM